MRQDQLHIERQLREFAAQVAEDRRRMRQSTLQDALANYKFPSQQARNDAKQLLLAKIEAPDNGLELADIYDLVDQEISKRPAWQPKPLAQEQPAETVQAAETSTEKSFDISRLDGPMTADDREEARLAIVRALLDHKAQSYSGNKRGGIY